MTLLTCFRAGRDGRPGWRLAWDYAPDVVEDLKARVPHTERAWDEDAGEWWVSAEYEDVLLALVPSFQAYRDQPRLL